MNIKYSTSEMGFEGFFPVNYPHLRVLETQLLFLEAYHLPLNKIKFRTWVPKLRHAKILHTSVGKSIFQFSLS